MKYNHKIILKDSEAADIGVGTMIVFISLVLVAGVAAGVLINVANELQIQSYQTADHVKSMVSSGLKIEEAIGDRIDSVEVVSISMGGPKKSISFSSLENKITTTTPHDLQSGDSIVIKNHQGSTPDINGLQTIAKTQTETTFTLLGVNITKGGFNGTLQLAGKKALVTTSSIHNFNNNDSIYLSRVKTSNSSSDLNSKYYNISVVSPTSFFLDNETVNKPISSGIVVKAELNKQISFLILRVSLNAGSPDIALDNVLIVITNDMNQRHLRFDSTILSQTQLDYNIKNQSMQIMNRATKFRYTAVELYDLDDTFNSTTTDMNNPNFIITKAVTIKIFIDLRASGIMINPMDTITISIKPQIAVPTEEVLSAPTTFSGRLIKFK